METIDSRSMLEAATAAAATHSGATPRIERRRRLTPVALSVVNEKVHAAYAPVVITGLVRLSDFLLISLTGIAIYLGYVVPMDGFAWSYVFAIIAVAFSAVICFQAADIYDVQVFRGQLRQMTRMISSWAFVFLLFIGASFFAKLGGSISRLWLSLFFLIGLGLLIASRLILRALVRRWGREGRLDRRTVIVGADDNGEKLVRALNAQAADYDKHNHGVLDERND
jgi:FlaA1/EpsC-like NDP-sugar epimerase